MSDGAGIRAVARLMRHLSEGCVVSADELASDCRIARSTAFDLFRRMEVAGFLVRDRRGGSRPGSLAFSLAFSAVGCPPIHGPAEPVLAWLAGAAGGYASLMVNDQIVIEVGMEHHGDCILTETLSGTTHLNIQLASNATNEEVDQARHLLKKAALTLIQFMPAGSRR